MSPVCESEDVVSSGWSPVAESGIGGDINDDHDDGDNSEEFGVDETASELVGQLIDYVSDLLLLP